MLPIIRRPAAILLLVLLGGMLSAVEPAADPLGEALCAAAIWTAEPVPAAAKQAVHGAFRRSVDLPVVPAAAPLRIFAATRYQLWVNGTYVLRGPARFELQTAEYDTVDIARLLHPGRNVLAVLVHRDRPTGRIRAVDPGLALDLDLGGGQRLRSDGSWRGALERSFGNTGGCWASLPDRRDATLMPDWTVADFDDGAWAAAVAVPRGGAWPRLVARRSERQRETAVPVGGPGLPQALEPGASLRFTTTGIVQAYPVVELEAAAGAELSLTYELPTYKPGVMARNGTDTWRCRAGRQTWMVDDTHALSALTFAAKGGAVRILGLRLVEVRYPFDVAGSFTCPDAALTHLWAMMARGAQILSEDAYVDCAERERVEWMECSPPMAQTTRVSMTTATDHGSVPSDPALLRAVLWHTAQTQRADGMVKAHTCSERWDKHAIMVDRSCDWIQLTRDYLDHTGDTAFVQEIWPAIARQLDAFLAKRTERGLIRLEEWADWGNPYKYRVFEGTVLNSFMQAALADGAVLARVAGDAAAATRFATAATELRATMLKELWDAKAGTMGAGLFELAAGAKEKRVGTYGGPSAGVGLCAATRHAAVYALRWNIIDEARREQLYQWLWSGRDETMKAEGAAMLFYHLFEVLYAHDDAAADAWVLEAMRIKWKPQLDSPMQVPGESLGANGVVHCYSMYPTYFLSSYVLGVRLDGALGAKRLLIEPRLGGLPAAAGTVVTELGLVPVAWTVTDKGGTMTVTIPAGSTARLRLPAPAVAAITLDGKAAGGGRRVGRWWETTIDAGSHQATWTVKE